MRIWRRIKVDRAHGENTEELSVSLRQYERPQLVNENAGKTFLRSWMKTFGAARTSRHDQTRKNAKNRFSRTRKTEHPKEVHSVGTKIF